MLLTEDFSSLSSQLLCRLIMLLSLVTTPMVLVLSPRTKLMEASL